MTNSKATYQRKLRAWGFRKYRKGTEWQAVAYHQAKRKRETGDKGELLIDGVQCLPAQISKRIARHTPISLVDKFLPRTGQLVFLLKAP